LLSEVERYQNVYRLKSPEWKVVKEKKSPEDHENFNYYIAFLNDVFYIGNRQTLGLYPKWHKYIKKLMAKENIRQIENAKVEAIALSHDIFDDNKLHIAYQPLSVQSPIIKLNNEILEATPRYLLPLVFFIAFSSIVFSTPFYDFIPDFYYGTYLHTLQNVLHLGSIVLLWLLSIAGMLLSLHRTVYRIKGNYFIT